MDNKKISIIVTAYNSEYYLRRCVRSILNQTHKNIELILVEDGSPDNCGKICDEFARDDERIVVIHQDNQGVCAGRNAGLAIASGDYIGFVDSDDYIDSDMYEYLLSSLEKYDADIASCRFAKVTRFGDVNSISNGELQVYDDAKQAVRDLLKKKAFNDVVWNKLYKKEIFEGMEFTVNRIYEGASLLHQLLLRSNRTVSLPEHKYYYVSNPDSYVHTKTLKNQCDCLWASISRYNDLAELLPDQQERMLKKILTETTSLVKTAYFNQEDVASCLADFNDFKDFYITNQSTVSKLKESGKLVKHDIAYVKNPTTFNLNKAFKLHELFDKEKGKYRTQIIRDSHKRITEGAAPAKPRINIYDFTQEDTRKFNKLHANEQELLDELARICDANNLSYFLYGGTLLGAVRHKGFIPWDDDIDIVMPREDYDKFAELCKTELGDKYLYQSRETEPDYPMFFCRLRKKNTSIYEEKFEGLDIHQGIFIDILPLDYFPNVTDDEMNKIMEEYYAYDAISKNVPPKAEFLYACKLCKEHSDMSRAEAAAKRDSFIRSVSSEATDKRVSYGSHYRPLSKRIFPAEWFVDDGTKMEFEGKMYTVPAGWKEYLTYLFSDKYMELPPLIERVNHFNFYDVVFDDE